MGRDKCLCSPIFRHNFTKQPFFILLKSILRHNKIVICSGKFIIHADKASMTAKQPLVKAKLNLNEENQSNVYDSRRRRSRRKIIHAMSLAKWFFYRQRVPFVNISQMNYNWTSPIKYTYRWDHYAVRCKINHRMIFISILQNQ